MQFIGQCTYWRKTLKKILLSNLSEKKKILSYFSEKKIKYQILYKDDIPLIQHSVRSKWTDRFSRKIHMI